MASLTRNKKTGNAVVQVCCPDGKRRSIRMGHASQGIAEEVRTRIEDLATCVFTGIEPQPWLQEWVDSASVTFRGRLAKVGLCDPLPPVVVDAEKWATPAQMRFLKFLSRQPQPLLAARFAGVSLRQIAEQSKTNLKLSRAIISLASPEMRAEYERRIRIHRKRKMLAGDRAEQLALQLLELETRISEVA